MAETGEKKKFVVFYDGNDTTIVEAASMKELIINFASFVGDCSTLFKKALVGCTTTEDVIEMFHVFSECDINAIFEIGSAIYQKN